MKSCRFGSKLIDKQIMNKLISKVKKINVEFDFDYENNELHFYVFDNEEYTIGILSDGFYINRINHYI